MIDTTNQTKHNKPNQTNKIAKGILAGNLINGFISSGLSNAINSKLNEKRIKINLELSEDEFQLIKDSTRKAFNDSGLKNKGVELIEVDSENISRVKDLIYADCNKGFLKFIPAAKKQAKNMIKELENGENSYYIPSAKKIIIQNNKKDCLASFHEIGHAINSNLSTTGKILAKSRQLALLSVPVLLIAMLKNKKEENEKPKNFFDKAGDFIKNNAGKLTFLTMLPTILEEGLATFHGNKLAKNISNTTLIKKVTKTNKLGLYAYLALAVTSSIGIYIGTKIKDRLDSDNNDKY